MGADLELAAVRSALSYLADFPPDTRLSINVSPAVAVTDDFVELVAPVAERLIIELTEHDPVEDYDLLVETLSQLRAMGALIAIDDVGAGFTTLRNIIRLAPDILKLDLSLTQTVERDSGSRALTSALIGGLRDPCLPHGHRYREHDLAHPALAATGGAFQHAVSPEHRAAGRGGGRQDT